MLLIVCGCDLGAQTFDFYAAGVRGDDVDVAPETGWFSFPSVPSSPPASPVAIHSVLVTQQPLLPKAGKRFTVGVMGVRLESSGAVVQPDSYSCGAILAGTALVGSGTGGCSWKLPKSARGKPLEVDVTVSYQGVSQTFSHTFKVK